MADRKSFLLRIDAELWAGLEAWAQDELRSVNGQIEWLLREALQRRGRTVNTASRTNARRARRDEQEVGGVVDYQPNTVP